MYIHEAIAACTPNKPFITRKRWKDMFGLLTGIKVFPTDSPDCCVFESGTNKSPCRGWQPTKEDLVANDWEPTG